MENQKLSQSYKKCKQLIIDSLTNLDKLKEYKFNKNSFSFSKKKNNVTTLIYFTSNLSAEGEEFVLDLRGFYSIRYRSTYEWLRKYGNSISDSYNIVDSFEDSLPKGSVRVYEQTQFDFKVERDNLAMDFLKLSTFMETYVFPKVEACQNIEYYMANYVDSALLRAGGNSGYVLFALLMTTKICTPEKLGFYIEVAKAKIALYKLIGDFQVEEIYENRDRLFEELQKGVPPQK